MSVDQFLRQGTAPGWDHDQQWRRDLEILLMHVCRLTRADLISHPERGLSDVEQRTLAALVERRRAGEPVAYLTGTRGFWSLELQVTRDTLIPRPETEHLVTAALAILPPGPARVADIGTGSGAIALALASERPELEITASDVSAPALEVARGNARRLGITGIRFVLGPYAQPLEGLFDVIVSNPPYVVSGDPRLTGPDLAFEPIIALRGGPDGLDALRRIAFESRSRLRPGAALLMEHGHDQQQPFMRLLQQYGYTDVRGLRDDAGLDRVVQARWGSHG